MGQKATSAAVPGLPTSEMSFGRSAAMQTIRQKLCKVAPTDIPVLIQGENGTGKEVLARLTHANSSRRNGPFVKVNCAAIPGPLLESELFGYEKGAFTGAHASKPGRVEMANGGTLFLDGIGDLDLSLQAKLLQFLQDGQFCRIGDHEVRRVDARVICSTNQLLEQEVEAGRFRLDLFYRINVIHIKLPPLRERREDIPLLSNHFLSVYAARFQRDVVPLSPGLLMALQQKSWPGNIRELENCIARYVLLGPEEALGVELPGTWSSGISIVPEPDGTSPLKRIADRAKRQIEHDLILKTLEANNWNRRRSAEALKISYRALLYKVRQAGLPSMRQRKKFGVPMDSLVRPSAQAD